MSNIKTINSAVDVGTLAKTYTALMVETAELFDGDPQNMVMHADLCEGLTAIKDRWELLFRPTLDLRRNRDKLLAPFASSPGAADIIDGAVTAMESMLEAVTQDFRKELQRITPLIIAARASKP